MSYSAKSVKMGILRDSLPCILLQNIKKIEGGTFRDCPVAPNSFASNFGMTSWVYIELLLKLVAPKKIPYQRLFSGYYLKRLA